MGVQDTFGRSLADQLVSLFRVADLTYIRISTSYDPAAGDVIVTETPYTAAGAVEQMTRTEEGGAAEVFSIDAWLNLSGIDDIWPTTADLLEYDGARWKITAVNPLLAGDQKYACKVTARRA